MPEAAARLHAFAVAAVAASARREPEPAPPIERALMVRAGVFVTLERRGELRGCIGHIEADTPLAPLTGRMARAAACEDPRFPPVRPSELAGLDVELSVLGPPAPGGADELVVGRHGVIVTRGRHRALLLPQVAPRCGWTADDMLEAVCRKAGLPPDAWLADGTLVELFEVQRITGTVHA